VTRDRELVSGGSGDVLFSAAGKLAGLDEVEELLDDVGVHGVLRDLLPFIQIAGATGALAGLIRWPRLGIAATIELFAYYAGAALFHLRADVDGYGIAAGYAVLALIATATRTHTLVNRSSSGGVDSDSAAA
jgi:hypothetical protein